MKDIEEHEEIVNSSCFFVVFMAFMVKK